MIRSRESSQIVHGLGNNHTLKVNGCVIDRMGLCGRVSKPYRHLPHVICLLEGHFLHEIEVGSVFFCWAGVLGHSPAAVSNISGALRHVHFPISNRIREFSVMSVMFHRCYEAEAIEKRRPKSFASLDNKSVVGSFVGIGAGWIDGVVIIGEIVVRFGEGKNGIIHELCLNVEWVYVP